MEIASTWVLYRRPWRAILSQFVKDYSHEGLGFSFNKWQADTVMKHMDSEEVKYFEKDKGAAKEPVKKYGTGDEKGNAPKQDF